MAPAGAAKAPEKAGKGAFQEILNRESGDGQPARTVTAETDATDRSAPPVTAKRSGSGEKGASAGSEEQAVPQPENNTPAMESRPEVVKKEEPTPETPQDLAQTIDPATTTILALPAMPAPTGQLPHNMVTGDSGTATLSGQPASPSNVPVTDTGAVGTIPPTGPMVTPGTGGPLSAVNNEKPLAVDPASPEGKSGQTGAATAQTVTDSASGPSIPTARNASVPPTESGREQAQPFLTGPDAAVTATAVNATAVNATATATVNTATATVNTATATVNTATATVNTATATANAATATANLHPSAPVMVQTGRVTVPGAGQPAVVPGPNRNNAIPLGESRFSQLLGHNEKTDTGLTGAATAVGPAAVPAPSLPGQAATTAHPGVTKIPGNMHDKGTLPGDGTAMATVGTPSPSGDANPFVAESPNGQSTAVEVSPRVATVPEATTPLGDPLAPSGGNDQVLMAAGMSVAPATAELPAATQSVPLPSANAFSVPEQKVMEQVIGHSSLRELGDKRQLTVELHPEELGQVKLELVQEKDRLQLHLRAATTEVRDILEKHMPRLQEALHQQGLRLENIQVSVDAQRNNSGGFFEHHRQQQAHQSSRQQTDHAPLRSAEPAMAAATAGQNPVSGLSLRI
jgi:flagellar hook-length control protein FliK